MVQANKDKPWVIYHLGLTNDDGRFPDPSRARVCVCVAVRVCVFVCVIEREHNLACSDRPTQNSRMLARSSWLL